MDFIERRTFTRIPIDMPIICQLRLSDEHSVPVILKDISRGGLQVSLSPGVSLAKDFLGQRVNLKGLPREISIALEYIATKICWQSPERLGLRFSDALSLTDERINEILDEI